MIAYIHEVCILDDLPIDESPMYQWVLWLWGEEKAREFVREVEIPLTTKPPPIEEMQDHGRPSGAGDQAS